MKEYYEIFTIGHSTHSIIRFMELIQQHNITALCDVRSTPFGIQATGKSTFYKTYFADTHIRINLDMLKTRHREKKLFECCLEIRQSFVIDNTNLSRQDRQRYIPTIQKYGVVFHGYYFASHLQAALDRNARRGPQAIPEKGILGAYKRLELPSYDEGFTKLYSVNLSDKIFEISEWKR